MIEDRKERTDLKGFAAVKKSIYIIDVRQFKFVTMENRNRISNELSIDLYRVQGANRLRTTMGGKPVGSVCALEEYGTNSLKDGEGELVQQRFENTLHPNRTGS